MLLHYVLKFVGINKKDIITYHNIQIHNTQSNGNF